MKNAAQESATKKKLPNKGERLGWPSLKAAKPVVLTDDLLKGVNVTKKNNGCIDPNLLLP